MLKLWEEKEKGFRDRRTLYIGSTEKTIGRKQDAFCLEVTRFTINTEEKLNMSSSVESPGLT